ncbi:MAG: 4Fe-4S binding protein [Deltaproteobacteria bacterium]|nr:4Fe-4S binding protein [Deltaproteobacteria bacterium]
MLTSRKIIEIDEEKCTGCGQCILACAEGALAMVDGKARLTGDVYCDGLGACIGECPEGALRIIERQADDFDEAAVEELLRNRPAAANELEHARAGAGDALLPCGCSSSQSMVLESADPVGADIPAGEIVSRLGHWPIKLQLLNPMAPFLKGSDLLLMADCTAAAFPDLHRRILSGRAVAMGCPKLDDIDAHINRLAEILEAAAPRSLTVVHMEVPCCSGFVLAAEKALERSGRDLHLDRMMISRRGEIMEQVAVI